MTAAGACGKVLLFCALLAARVAVAVECRIAVLGDSLVAGYGIPLETAFPARLEAALRARGYPCRVINAGVSGDTSAGGLARLSWVLAERPTHLLLELGANDGLRALPVTQLERNLAAIITQAREAGVAVFLVGMYAPPNWGSDYTTAFAAVYRRLAARFRVPLYPFFLEGVMGRPELLLRDGLHPNPRGVEEIMRRILPHIERWLEATRITPEHGPEGPGAGSGGGPRPGLPAERSGAHGRVPEPEKLLIHPRDRE